MFETCALCNDTVRACVCVCAHVPECKKDDGMLLKVPQLGEGLS